MRILLAFGTRPEIIKLAPLYRILADDPRVELDVFWSGQHQELADGLLELFDIRVSHYGTEVMEESGIAGKLGQMMRQVERVLLSAHYDWLIVQGDTTTATAAATVGFLNRVPVAHVEAGLRSGNLLSPWPEEFNRRVVTMCAKAHFAPTPAARANLLAEGVPETDIFVVGNTVIDALLQVRAQVGVGYVPSNTALRALPLDKKLVLVTMHRRENFGERLREVLSALKELGADGDKLMVLPMHLNPVVRNEVQTTLGGAANVLLLEPLQYPDLIYLLARSWVVVTDSGGLQEEAPTFGLPVIITRDTTERPEVVEAGFGRLVGSSFAAITQGVRQLTSSAERQLIAKQNPFGSGDSSLRIAGKLMDLSRANAAARVAAPGAITVDRANADTDLAKNAA